MKKIVLFLLISSSSIAQNKIISQPTIAYSDSSCSRAVGIFMRGALVEKWEQNPNYSYTVYTSYTEPVYIRETYHLKDILSSTDQVGTIHAVLVDTDDFYYGPHLFTRVAGLKVRAQSDLGAAVLGKLLNGTPICIMCLSYIPDALIMLDYQGKKGYVPLEFLCKRPIMRELYTLYQNSTTAEDMKKYAERILELGWNSMPEENAEALEIYAYYAEFVGNHSVAKLCRLQAETMKNIAKGFEEFIVEQLLDQKNFGFALNNELEPANGFSLSFLQKNLGPIIKSHSDLDDCGLGDYENNVFFAHAECISHDINKTYTLRKLKIKGNQGFKIYNQFLDENTTEVQFLSLTKNIVNYIYGKNASYLIGTDGYAYEFQFVNGKLSQINLNYYC